MKGVFSEFPKSVEFELYPQKMWINLYIAVMTAGARSYITQGGFSSVQKKNRFLRY